MGGQNTKVRLISSAASFDSATRVFSADVAVENLLRQTLGTPDGVTVDPEGIRVFFFSGPVATAGSGQVSVANADGTGAFTAAGQPFFRYPAVLAPGDTTAAKTWRFNLEPGVVAFAFRVFLDVQVEPRLVITEIMARPLTASETAGEWFEVYNAGDVRADLNGYTIASGGDAGYTVPGSLVMNPGDRAVLGASTDSVANGGAPVRQAYTGVTLGNDTDDWLALRAATGVTLDSVSWGAAPGDAPTAPRAGIARALIALDSSNVNLSGAHAHWEDAAGTYGPALQRGTPGSPNLFGVSGGWLIEAGQDHTCMIDRDGVAWCWGRGNAGALGTGTPSAPLLTRTRLRVGAPAGVRFGRLAASGYESCAISYLGDVYCWGWTMNVITNIPTPFPNAAATLIVSLAAGANEGSYGAVCEIDPAGAAYCRGTVVTTNWNTWVALSNLSTVPLTVSQMALGTQLACALAGGRVYCYGQNNSGQVGDSTTSFRGTLVETRLPQGVLFRSVAAAGASACALSEGGQAYCWGRNQSGQLGIGAADANAHPMPVAVQQPAGVTFTSLEMGEYQARAMVCGLTADGQAYCWGQNDNGRVGDGTETQRPTPTPVVQRGGLRFSAITVGGYHTCALEEGTGQPYCWGYNNQGQIGDGSTAVKRLLPVPTVR